MDILYLIITIIKYIIIFIIGVMALLLLFMCIPIFVEIDLNKEEKFIGYIKLRVIFGMFGYIIEFTDNKLLNYISIFGHKIKLDEGKNIETEGQKTNEESSTSSNTGEQVNTSLEHENIENDVASLTPSQQTKRANFQEKFNRFKKLFEEGNEIRKCTSVFLIRVFSSLNFNVRKIDVKIFIQELDNFGYACAFLSAIEVFWNEKINVNIYNDKDNFEGNMNMRISVLPIKILYYAILYILEKPVRKFIIKKLFRKESGEYGI